MANHRRVTPEQETVIVDMVLDGHCATVIAKKLDVKVKTLYDTMRRMGIPIRRSARRSGITVDQIQEMVRLYAGGIATKELGKQFGITDGTVSSFLREAGVEIRPKGFRFGEDHHQWKGGRLTTEGGYIMVQLKADDPFYAMAHFKGGVSSRYVLEHRIVMARQLGRMLRDEETVHHIDNNRQNNAPENLQLRQGRHGKGAAFRCADCGSYNIEATAIADPPTEASAACYARN